MVTGVSDTVHRSRIGAAVADRQAGHDGESGVHTLDDGIAAYAARVLLANHAEHTLDVQYYIWQHDLTGVLMLDALYRAAERGVRVRLLLDDNNTGGLDRVLAVFDCHPNIEVRLFNAFKWRRFRLLGYLTDFARQNRRMHNKSFTADRLATIVGGRNIGDEYFDVSEEVVFADLDVLAVGPVSEAVSDDFQRYWDSEAVQGLDGLIKPATPEDVAAWRAEAKTACAAPNAVAYRAAVEASSFMQRLLDGDLPLIWARTHMLSDPPAKGLGRAEESELLPANLEHTLGKPVSELLLVSPYFVPTAAGVRMLGGLAAQGVTVTVLTNAFEATDVAVVHSGYAKRRRALLRRQVRLYEMKRQMPDATPNRPAPHRLGSSSSSLHAKTFAVDRKRVFIGSLNFDPRSARLNTEMGFVIESPALAEAMVRTLHERMPDSAYEVVLARIGVAWREHTPAGVRLHRREPGMNAFQRIAVRILQRLPIEWLL